VSTTVAEPLTETETETNPDRPTKAGYCANCGCAPCFAAAFLAEMEGKAWYTYRGPTAGSCIAEVQPITFEAVAQHVLFSKSTAEAVGRMSHAEVVNLLIRYLEAQGQYP